MVETERARHHVHGSVHRPAKYNRQLVANIMDWRYIRHLLVEDQDGRFCGLVSHRDLLHLLAKFGSDQQCLARPVREIMHADPVTTSPATPLADAIRIVQEARTDSLPVISEGRLVGIVTTHDVLRVLGKILAAEQSNFLQPENSKAPKAFSASSGAE
jgi:CBS domain-containing membrane protein